jgi:hypothetical protein
MRDPGHPQHGSETLTADPPSVLIGERYGCRGISRYAGSCEGQG